MRALLFSLLLVSLPVYGAPPPEFLVAGGKIDITPDLENETIWLAGYGATGRRAKGIRDKLYARGLMVSDGKKTVALVAVDTLGVFRADILDMRKRLGWEGKDRYLFVSATHDHSAPDLAGMWGRFPGISGVDKRYLERVKTAVVDLVGILDERLQEAEMIAARAHLEPRGLCKDVRDPVVLDPELNVLSFRTPDGKSLGTLVRWSCHAEVMDEDNHFVTADFPGALCAKIEEETGGPCVYFPGSIGGLLSPVVDRSPGIDHQFEESRRLGEKVAEAALAALKAKPDRYRKVEVSFETAPIKVRVDNSRYLLFLNALRGGHKLYDEGGRVLGRMATLGLSLRHLVFFPLPAARRPWVRSEVSLVRIGPVKILGIPGEIFPELVIGGYGGEHAYGYPLVGPENENPPQLDKAPKGPYIREKLGAKHGWVVGLANDELGYIIPGYDFEVNPNRSMSPGPQGTHYEETNSVGRGITDAVLDAVDELLGQ